MESNQFTVTDVIKLFRTAHQYNIAHFAYGGLVFRRNDEKVEHVKTKVNYAEDVMGPDKAYTLPDPMQEKQSLPELEEYDKENLLITDPLEYERQVANAE